jgi:hypothetical protein
MVWLQAADLLLVVSRVHRTSTMIQWFQWFNERRRDQTNADEMI